MVVSLRLGNTVFGTSVMRVFRGSRSWLVLSVMALWLIGVPLSAWCSCFVPPMGSPAGAPTPAKVQRFVALQSHAGVPGACALPPCCAHMAEMNAPESHCAFAPLTAASRTQPDSHAVKAFQAVTTPAHIAAPRSSCACEMHGTSPTIIAADTVARTPHAEAVLLIAPVPSLRALFPAYTSRVWRNDAANAPPLRWLSRTLPSRAPPLL